MPKAGAKREARADDIVKAALAEFAANGFAATRIEDVARRAGVAKGTLYLHFTDKEALFKAVVRSSIVSKLEQGEIAAAGFEGSAEALVRGLLLTFVKEIVSSELSAIIRLLIAESGRFPELADFYYDEVVRRAMGALRAIVARGVATGELRQTAVQDFPQILAAPLIMAVVWRTLFERRQPLDTEMLVTVYLDTMFAGLRAP